MNEHIGLWAVDDAAFPALSAAIQRAMLVGPPSGGEPPPVQQAYAVEGCTARVFVRGLLLSDATGPAVAEAVKAMSGAVQYKDMLATARAAVSDGLIQDLVLDWDSRGGDVAGSFEAAEELRALAAIKPIRNYARGHLCSAAYFCAAACGPIEAGPMAVLGSIGIRTSVIDRAAADRAAGVAVYTMSNAQSPRKAPDPSQPGGLDDVQRMLDETGAVFIAAVARYRGVTEQHVIEQMGQGAALVGASALAARLCDSVTGLEAAAQAAAPPGPQTDRPVGAAGDTMETCELQCRAALAAALACLALLSADDEAHAAARTACEGVETTTNACIEAGAEPGSDEAVACADACDAAMAALADIDMPEARACAASCESCALACRGGATEEAEDTGGEATAKEQSMTEKQLRAENARLQAQLAGRTDQTAAMRAELDGIKTRESARTKAEYLAERDGSIRTAIAEGRFNPADAKRWQDRADKMTGAASAVVGPEALAEFKAILADIPKGGARPVARAGTNPAGGQPELSPILAAAVAARDGKTDVIAELTKRGVIGEV